MRVEELRSFARKNTVCAFERERECSPDGVDFSLLAQYEVSCLFAWKRREREREREKVIIIDSRLSTGTASKEREREKHRSLLLVLVDII